MIVHIKHLGCASRREDGKTKWYHLYYLKAANGVEATDEDEDWIKEGYYELPDKDWIPRKTKGANK